ncbi:MAG: Tol-Pal system beta propeller repeat protein TolB [Chromatiales bacterium]|nr:Tol-Pal system beta propeller repeat protein TolB [Chromatiales bacterium]
MCARCKITILLILFCFSTNVQAQLKIEITEGVVGGVPIVVLPFVGEPTNVPRNYSEIIASDLAYSGLFYILDNQNFSELSTPNDKINYADWLANGAEKIISGIVDDSTLIVRLDDAVKESTTKEWKFSLKDNLIKTVSHYASDLIYEELTGIAGIFSTRLAFISSDRLGPKERKFYLNIADADGWHASAIYTSDATLMSPTWSHDYKRIAYVSYENNEAQIFLQVLSTGQRNNLSEIIGSAYAPAWSSDNNRLSFVASRNGNSDIYTYRFDNQEITQVTRSLAIDTEPAWIGNDALVFTSDRSGSPQLYSVSLSDGEITRLSFEGNYNADADVSTDKTKLAYISQRSNGFSVVIRDLTDDNELVLSFGGLDERPRFAPNGHLLSYITTQNGKSAIGLLTIDGALGELIPVEANNIRGIAWSPLIQQ